MGEGKRRQLRYDELQRIIDAGDRPEMRAVTAEITKYLVDKGNLVEAGWIGFMAAAMPDNAPDVQVEEMRNAFFAGAQHIFGSITSFLSDGPDPTAEDFERFVKINAELTAFYKDFMQRYALHHAQAEGQS